jgi:hypothetical protein
MPFILSTTFIPLFKYILFFLSFSNTGKNIIKIIIKIMKGIKPFEEPVIIMPVAILIKNDDTPLGANMNIKKIKIGNALII